MSDEPAKADAIQILALRLLSAVRVGAVQTFEAGTHGGPWLIRWTGVLFTGVVIGLSIYALLLTGVHAGIPIALAKVGLYKPTTTTKAKRRSIRGLPGSAGNSIQGSPAVASGFKSSAKLLDLTPDSVACSSGYAAAGSSSNANVRRAL